MDWSFFSPNHILIYVLGYGISFIELVGTLSGLVSVWLGTRNHIGIWYAGLINVICFFVIFLSVRLYADMLLQVFYFIVTLYGLANWRNRDNSTLSISRMSFAEWEQAVFIAFGLFIFFIFFSSQVPLILNIPAPSFKILDALLSAASVSATFMMSKRKIEAWLLWVVIDFVSVWMYVQKGVMLIAIEFLIFGVLAIVGYVQWRKVFHEQ